MQAGPIYSVSSIVVDGTTSGNPATGSPTYDIDITVNFSDENDVSGASQDFENTVNLIRDDDVDAMAGETISSSNNSYTHSNTYTLQASDPTTSYMKVVVLPRLKN